MASFATGVFGCEAGFMGVGGAYGGSSRAAGLMEGAVADARGLSNLVSEAPSITSFVHEIFTGDRLNAFSRSAEHVPTRFGLVNLRWSFS